MRRRLAAATGGAVLIAAAVLTFSLGKHPVIAGTNSAAPLLPAMVIPSGETRCETVSQVPAGASHVRVVASSIEGRPGDLRVTISGLQGQQATSGTGRIGPAGRVIRLMSTTRTLHPARICLHYLGQGHVTLAGEKKRVRSERVVGGPEKRGVASVVFLRPGLTSWASRRDLIAERYANSQASPFGTWSFWVAVLAAIGAAVLALLWVVFRLDDANGARGERR
jgi:hypothetical protein